ncbi:MAG: isochorismatase family protein [Candidatus Sericytochromatia bacterium]
MESLRLSRDRAVVVLVDVQERLFAHIYENQQLERNLLRLLQGLQILELPIVVTQQYTRGLGPTIPALQRLFDTPALEKMHFSCCGSAEFNQAVDTAKTVILCGIEGHVCVMQTALDLLAQGKRVVWVDDCIGSRRPSDKALALQRLLPHGLVPASTESLLLELCEISGTPEFKAISGLIKEI